MKESERLFWLAAGPAAAVALGIVLIPWLDELLQEATARKTAALTKLAEAERRKDRLA